MFNLTFIKGAEKKFDHYLIKSKEGTKVAIYPEYGASLMQLSLNNKTIINNINEKDGEVFFLNSSCSVILFPFANRIKDGKYHYNGVSFQLECNEKKLGHALHGLVNKSSFRLSEFYYDEKSATIIFTRSEKDNNEGFPFPFDIKLSYTLKSDSLQLNVGVTNTGRHSFPFSLGWHPYFYSSNLDLSKIEIDSEEKIINDDRMIPVKVVEDKFPNPLLLKEQEFDNSFILKNNTVAYHTPDHSINIRTEGDDSKQYIHLYIPSHRQSIAIEPMTAAADCFNNNIGTKELQAGKDYQIDWIVELI
jgi:aldose 1-epimerase